MTVEVPRKAPLNKDPYQSSLKSFFQKKSENVQAKKFEEYSFEPINEEKVPPKAAEVQSEQIYRKQNPGKPVAKLDRADQQSMELKTGSKKRVISSNKKRAIESKIQRNNTSNVQVKQPFVKGFVGRSDLFGMKIKEVIDQIQELEKDRTDFLKFFEKHFVNNQEVDLREYKVGSQSVFFEDKISYPVPDRSLKKVSILASDAGVASTKYLGYELSLISVALTHFEYQDDQISEVVYYPDDESGSYGFVFNGSHRADSDIDVFTSLERSFAELSSIISFLETYPLKKVHLVILDGALRIEPFKEMFRENRAYVKKYAELLNTYEKLYSICQRKKIMLIGSVKNTESIEFRENINRSIPLFIKLYPSLKEFYKVRYRDLLEDFNDSYFLYRILDINQRSAVFELNSRSTDKGFIPGIPVNKPISLSQPNRQYLCFYMQVVPYEAPLRIEFLYDADMFSNLGQFKSLNNSQMISKLADQISGLILPLANKLGLSSLPIPQVEAHNRATLTLNEFKIVDDEIKSRYVVELMGRFKDDEKKLAESQSQKENVDNLTEAIDMKQEHIKEFMGVFLQRRRSTPL